MSICLTEAWHSLPDGDRVRLTKVTLALFAFGLLTGCVSGGARPGEHWRSGQRTITQDDLDRSAATNVWDLMRSQVQEYNYVEDRSGRPIGITTRRGSTRLGLTDSDTPMIVIDGARIIDIGTLRDLPTGAVDSIELLSSIRGTSIQGTNANAGVIYIHTRAASSGLP